MANRIAVGKRARDEDRVATCASLDAGLADGQLSSSDHEARVRAAMAARTIRELNDLTADLQGAAPLLDFAKTPSRPRSPGVVQMAVSAMATLLVLGLCIWGAGKIVGGGGEDGGGGDGPESVVEAEKNGYLSPYGLAEVVAAIRDAFGDTRVDDLTLYEEYAVVFRADTQTPRKQLSYYFKGEFREPSESGTRAAAAPVVDLADMDIAWIAGIVAGAGPSLNLTDVSQIYLVIRPTDDGDSEVVMHAKNELEESGFLTADLRGHFLSVYPFDPSK
ncbi:DUF1707 SHOCT-like domain-containing protein [Antrihabitans spumae]|uniref:DUF1707 domain-containing protein n=1 Tax=Antrihabitans spumae TaxID=3373370 RepID=A0ABW7KEX4_9NOCA